jgi:hypothetical protein
MCDPKAVGAEGDDAKAGISPQDRAAYRERLLNSVERMELEYDKALLVLHPLGISVTSALFVALLNSASIVHHRNYLFGSWFVWMGGVVFTLASFRLSAIKRDDYAEKGNSLPPSPKPMKTSTTQQPQPKPQKDAPKK